MIKQSLQSLLTEIKTLVSCPPKIYCHLYLATLNQFIIQCPKECIKERLWLTVIVLKLRRGVLLPKNAGAEVIAAEEAQWTYAIFSASLLKDLPYDLSCQVVPKIAENWLKENNNLYKQWKDCLSNAEAPNAINTIIYRANELLGSYKHGSVSNTPALY